MESSHVLRKLHICSARPQHPARPWRASFWASRFTHDLGRAIGQVGAVAVPTCPNTVRRRLTAPRAGLIAGFSPLEAVLSGKIQELSDAD